MKNWQELMIWSCICSSLVLVIPAAATVKAGFNSIAESGQTKKYSTNDNKISMLQHVKLNYSSGFRPISTVSMDSQRWPVPAKLESESNETVFHSHKTLIDSTIGRSSLKSRQPNSRLPVISQDMEIVYHFHCEQSGTREEHFAMRAVSYGVSHQSYNLELEDRGNIDWISAIRYERQHYFSILPVNFFATFESHICHILGTLICSNSFSGHIEGVLSYGYLWLLVVTDVHFQEKRPRITENCVSIHGRGVCPALTIHQNECFVQAVSVAYPEQSENVKR